jgi:cyclic beta-1,2-glucan synthetase
MFPSLAQQLAKQLRRMVGQNHEPENPIRSELFSIERLEQHAESLALAQRVSPKLSGGIRLLPRVKDNARVLKQGYKSIAQAIREERAITPASDWLVDNFHVIEDQIREIIDDLPPGFYRRLPKLADGVLKGTPRIYGIAWAFVAHTDSRFDPEWMKRFVRAYQRVDVLSIGEIWALAISLRIVLVENLRRITERIMISRLARQEADALADTVLGLKQKEPTDATAILSQFDGALLKRAFSVQLVQRLRDQGDAVAPALRWLDERLAAQGTSADEIVRGEHQDQAAMNATVRNVVTSMRLISALDWAQFFEDVSVVDEILRSAQGTTLSTFGAMDFATRDRYRHAIEELSRRSDLSEVDVTRRAVHAARRAPHNDDPIENERKKILDII